MGTGPSSTARPPSTRHVPVRPQKRLRGAMSSSSFWSWPLPLSGALAPLTTPVVCSGSLPAVRFGGREARRSASGGCLGPAGWRPLGKGRSPPWGKGAGGPICAAGTASSPAPALQDPLLPGQLAAARHRDHHHRLVPPGQGRAEQGLGPGPARRAAASAAGRVRVLGRPAPEPQVHPRPGAAVAPGPRVTWSRAQSLPPAAGSGPRAGPSGRSWKVDILLLPLPS